ncbi:hypothetical protein RJ55_06739 [Drechmeria coniospora]|nr:hypothetical protein RJ55_06739 [Drechmeria coniospora]
MWIYIGKPRVSDMTPSQLARKRASDRNTQRTIRARTKAHIERLERELQELQSHQNCDKTIEELLRINKALEEENWRLRFDMGLFTVSSSYLTQADAVDNSHVPMLYQGFQGLPWYPSAYDGQVTLAGNENLFRP